MIVVSEAATAVLDSYLSDAVREAHHEPFWVRFQREEQRRMFYQQRSRQVVYHQPDPRQYLKLKRQG